MLWMGCGWETHDGYPAADYHGSLASNSHMMDEYGLMLKHGGLTVQRAMVRRCTKHYRKTDTKPIINLQLGMAYTFLMKFEIHTLFCTVRVYAIKSTSTKRSVFFFSWVQYNTGRNYLTTIDTGISWLNYFLVRLTQGMDGLLGVADDHS